MEDFSGIGCAHLRYHRWALERYFAALEQLSQDQLRADHGVSFGSIHGTLLHLHQADSIWCARLTGEPATPETASGFAANGAGLLRLKEAWFRLLDAMTIWAGGLANEAWFQAVEYANSKGILCRTPVWQAVLQMVNHGTAHRGQIAAILRQIGVPPPGSDLITFYRMAAA